MKLPTDRRWRVLAASVAMIVVLGALFYRLPGGGVEIEHRADTGAAPREHVVVELFRQGAVMLHARRYDLASVVLHRLLQLAPALPEAHVNMGYTQLGLGQPLIAEDFFRTAIELRAEQANAYYGLALALEAQNDLESARGAMRTYLHLVTPNDPYARKAQAAIWEWSAGVAEAAGGGKGAVRDFR